ATEENRERSAALEPIHPRDDRVERLLIAPIAIDGVEAGRPATRFVRLRQRLDRQAEGVRQITTRPGNIVVHTLNAVAAFEAGSVPCRGAEIVPMVHGLHAARMMR